MNTTESAIFLEHVAVFWPGTVRNQIAESFWADALKAFTLDNALRFLTIYAQSANEQFPPKPGDLLRIAAEALLDLPSEDDAWRIVRREAARVGTSPTIFHAGQRYTLRPSFEVPEIAAAVESVGWRVILEGAGETYVIHQFKEAYGRYVERTRKTLQVEGDAVVAFRARLADSVTTIGVGPPQGLRELGAPESYVRALEQANDDERHAAIPAAIDVSPEKAAARGAAITAAIGLLADRRHVDVDRRTPERGAKPDGRRAEPGSRIRAPDAGRSEAGRTP